MENNIVVIYEDEDVLVVNKPSGMMVHPDGHTDEQTVVDWFLQEVPAARGVGEPGVNPQGVELERSGIVHRLDRETSGVLVLVKNQTAHAHIKAQFHDRRAEKEYRAFVFEQVKEKGGTIDREIGRSAKDFRLRSAQRGAKGVLRRAVTDWELIAQNEECAYLSVMPKTGRTHQIRVHLKAINHPVVCDTLYAPKRGCALGLSRLALHAYRLTLELPSGTTRVFEAALPPDFVAAEATLRAE